MLQHQILSKTAGVKRPRKPRKSTKSASTSNQPSSPKSKTPKECQPKKRRVRKTGKGKVKKGTQQDHNASITAVKLQSKEARPPSGLETPLSTSSWDLYLEKMPDDIAEAVTERIEWWLFQKDTPADYERRCERYGEDIASSFPGGGTPRYAQLLEKVEQDVNGNS